jgi:hypothetical protein
MMAGICELVSRDSHADDRIQLDKTFKHLRELTRIMETEIHEAVLSCTRARRQMLEASPQKSPRSTDLFILHLFAALAEKEPKPPSARTKC